MIAKSFNVYGIEYPSLRSNVFIYGEEMCSSTLFVRDEYDRIKCDMDVQRFLSMPSRITVAYRWRYHLSKFMQYKCRQGKIVSPEEWEVFKVELKLLAI